MRVRIRCFSGPFSVRMRENTDQKNSEHGLFLRSVYYLISSIILSFDYNIVVRLTFKEKIVLVVYEREIVCKICSCQNCLHRCFPLIKVITNVITNASLSRTDLVRKFNSIDKKQKNVNNR